MMVKNIKFTEIPETEFKSLEKKPIPEESYSAILGTIGIRFRKEGRELFLNGTNVKIFLVKPGDYLIKHLGAERKMKYFRLSIENLPALDLSIAI